MPWSTVYSKQGADIRFTGHCNGAEVYDANVEVFTHDYAEGLRYTIIDFAPADFVDLPTADLARIAEHDRQYLLRNPPYALVIIAPQGVVLGHARRFEEFMEGSSLRSQVVRTREEAFDWLREQHLMG